jgi:hypothetical protein
MRSRERRVVGLSACSGRDFGVVTGRVGWSVSSGSPRRGAWMCSGVRGPRVEARSWPRRAATRSGDERDALVSAGECRGGGPVVEESHDVLAGATHDAGGGVPELPPQRLGFRDGEGPVETVELEPADEIRGERDDREAGPVGVERGCPGSRGI